MRVRREVSGAIFEEHRERERGDEKETYPEQSAQKTHESDESYPLDYRMKEAIAMGFPGVPIFLFLFLFLSFPPTSGRKIPRKRKRKIGKPLFAARPLGYH
jgi:hypothetical protein